MQPTARMPWGSIIGRSLMRQIPFLALFYIFDYFIWSSNGGSRTPGNDANLVANIIFSTLFILAFFGLDVGRQVMAARKMLKNPPPPPQVVYVQQPVYVQGPPPYGYQQPQQGYYQQYSPPPELPPQSPPGQPRDPRGGGQQ